MFVVGWFIRFICIVTHFYVLELQGNIRDAQFIENDGFIVHILRYDKSNEWNLFLMSNKFEQNFCDTVFVIGW